MKMEPVQPNTNGIAQHSAGAVITPTKLSHMIDSLRMEIYEFEIGQGAMMGPATDKTRGSYWIRKKDILPSDKSGYSPMVRHRSKTGDYYNGCQNGAIEVTVSAPKLLFGTNLAEVQQEDLDRFLDALAKKLGVMGIKVSRSALLTARIGEVDLCKNIILPEGEESAQCLALISGIGLRPRNWFRERQYDPGIALKFFNKTRHLAIYAKFPEIANHKNTPIEKEIAALYERGKISDCVIRIEEKFKWKQSISRALDQCGLHPAGNRITISDVWKTDFSRQTLLRAIRKAYGHRFVSAVGQVQIDKKEVLKLVESKIKKERIRNEVVCLLENISKVGAKAAFDEYKRKHSPATLYRIKNRIRTIFSEIEFANPVNKLIKHILASLAEFKPFTEADMLSLLGSD